MKKIAVMLVILITMLPCVAFAQAEDKSFDEVLQSELEKFDLSPLDNLREKYSKGDVFSGKSAKEVVLGFAKGESELNSQTIMDYVVTMIMVGLKDGMLSLAFILMIVIICGVLKSMAAESLGDVSDICEYVGYIMVVYMLIGTFTYYVNLTVDLMSLMQSAVRIIFPPLLTLMTAVGGISSFGVFKPAMAVLSGGMIEFITTTIMPMAVFGGITGILSGISSKISLKGISDFCSSLCKWLMGIAFTIYAGILSVQGIMASTYDGISIRTAKYTVDSFMPIIGGMMSDTVDTVLGCSLLIKNAIGFTGLLVIASMIMLPLIKYITCILSYKLLSALISTTNNSSAAKAIEGLIQGITTLFTIVSVVGVMTFITIGLAVNAGNTNLMLR